MYIKNHLIKSGDHVILGISGGPDSLALLHLLASLRNELNYKLHLAHFNHQLRGRAADKDEIFVRSLSEKYNIHLAVRKFDVADFAK